MPRSSPADRHRLDALGAVLGSVAPQRRQEILAALRDLAAAAGATRQTYVI
ncbi:MAG: hypothetical protein ACRDTE_20745 [Pseudonocardiaceae bacterium]